MVTTARSARRPWPLALAAWPCSGSCFRPPRRGSGPGGKLARAVPPRWRRSVSGGSDQWVLERSEDTGNPVVLFLHGGPGTSQLTSNRRDTRSLEKYFTVVNWDQRGAGKSYGAIGDPDRMNIGQFVADTRELTVYLLKKFHQDRLVLVGHSWGTVVGALAVSRYPELYSCYVGIGQLGKTAEGEAASYRWTLDQARKHHKRRAVDALVAMGPPPYEGDWQKKTITQRSYLARFGGEVYRSRFGASGRWWRACCSHVSTHWLTGSTWSGGFSARYDYHVGDPAEPGAVSPRER